MTTDVKIYLGAVIAIAAVLLALIGVVLQIPSHPPLGASANGTPTTVATSSGVVVGTTATTILATSTCSARVISTVGTGPIQLTFNDKYTPTGSFGIGQAASTTVVYDSGQYGCGAVKAFAYVAQTITIQDSR